MDRWLSEYFPPIFVLLWLAISLIVSRVGGWATLAQDYRAGSDFLGARWRFRSISLRLGTNYNGVVTVGADPTSLFLSCIFLFRLGHPPLLIPWPEISVEHERRMFLKLVTLRTSRHPSLPIRMSARLFERLEAARERRPMMG